MIQVTCSGCGVKLNAKDEMAGQTRPCPKCGTPLLIAPAMPPSPAAEEGLPPPSETPRPSGAEEIVPPPAEGLPSQHCLERLNRQHLYLICDRTKVFASWENNSQGWLIRARPGQAGMVSAVRNQQLLPNQGSFCLVEVKTELTEAGVRLLGLTCYQLAERWALPALVRGDDAIVDKIVGHAGLNREQKNAVRAALKDRFMHDVWQHAETLSEFLGNADYHSYEV